MDNAYCENCHKTYQRQRVTSRFCSDVCRVKFHREQKAQNRLKSPKEQQFDMLVLSIRDSINRLEIAAAKAEEFSKDNSRNNVERMGLIAMFREKTAIANELKLLLEMNEENAALLLS